MRMGNENRLQYINRTRVNFKFVSYMLSAIYFERRHIFQDQELKRLRFEQKLF